MTFLAPDLPADGAGTATGLYLLAWTVFTAYMTATATRVSGAVLGVFVLLTLTFLALTVSGLDASTTIGKLGGWLGLATALVAWYASFAGVTGATCKRVAPPTWPMAK